MASQSEYSKISNKRFSSGCINKNRLECLSRSPPTAMWSNMERANYYNKQAKDDIMSSFQAKCTRPGGCKMNFK